MIKARRKWLRGAFISLSLLLAAGVAFFFALPALLIAPVDTPKSDIILHSALDPHSTADEYVASLYRQGVARKIVCVSSQVSHDLYPADYAREHLISLGVPPEDVLSLRLPIAPCAAMNLPSIVEFVKARGWKSVLLIAQPEGSRFAARTIRKYFERENIGIAVSYAPEDREELTRNWWRAHRKVQRFVGETMNIVLDLFYSECR